MSASLQLPGGLKTLNPQPEITRYYNNAGTAYTNTAQVISEVVLAARYIGQTFLVGTTEYWFSPTTADGNLVTKLLLNTITGTGTTNTIPKFSGASTLANSTITDTGSLITLGVNTTVTSGNVTHGTTTLTENIVKLNAMGNSTGLYSFASGGITMASTTQVNIGAAQGFIVDSDNPLSNPTAVSYAGVSNLTPSFIGSAAATYFLITPSNTLLQLNTRPTVTQRRDNIFLGVVGHPAGTLTGIGNDPDLCLNFMSQFRAMFEPTRLINEGVVAYAGAANLSLYNTAGKLYGLGIGFAANGNDAPSLINIAGGAPMTTQYRTSVGVPSVGGTNRTTAVPDRYESGGVDIAIPGNPNQATNQRIYLIQNGAIRIQYGQALYPTLADAISAATGESFVVNVNAVNLGILIGILSIQKGCTNLQNTATARFLPVSKFGETVGAAAGISIGTLQTAYNNSIDPEIITNNTLGAFSVKRGSASDGDNVLEIQNGAGTPTMIVDGLGNVFGTSYIKAAGTSSQYLMADGSVSTLVTNRGYKTYSVVLNQLGTANPTSTVLGTNDIGAIVWTRNSTGAYFGTLVGAFTASKSFAIITKSESTGDPISIMKGIRNSADIFQLSTHNSAGTLTDGLLNNTLVELRVYN